jgi:hypothetical protein
MYRTNGVAYQHCLRSDDLAPRSLMRACYLLTTGTDLAERKETDAGKTNSVMAGRGPSINRVGLVGMV